MTDRVSKAKVVIQREYELAFKECQTCREYRPMRTAADWWRHARYEHPHSEVVLRIVGELESNV